jgi:hypothetical protein
MFLKHLVCRAVAAKQVTVGLKGTIYLTSYMASSLLAVALSAQVALAAERCEERYSELTEKYNLAYTKLNDECWPRFDSAQQAESFEMSPECIDKYNLLNVEWNESSTALFTECSDVLFPTPIEQTPAEQQPESKPTEGSSDIAAPSEGAIPPVSKKCEERYAAIGDKFSAAYVNLEAECYPADAAAWCGVQLSPECVERYEALNKESNDVYSAYYEECYGAGWGAFFGITDSASSDNVEKAQSEAKASTAQVVAAPTKKEMLKRIKSLKKQLRRAKASNKKMRARCSK